MTKYYTKGSTMIAYRGGTWAVMANYWNAVITDDNGEVVRYITIRDILDVVSLDFRILCGKPGYYTCRIDGDDLDEILMDYDFWLKPEGNDLREIPLSLV